MPGFTPEMRAKAAQTRARNAAAKKAAASGAAAPAVAAPTPKAPRRRGMSPRAKTAYGGARALLAQLRAKKGTPGYAKLRGQVKREREARRKALRTPAVVAAEKKVSKAVTKLAKVEKTEAKKAAAPRGMAARASSWMSKNQLYVDGGVFLLGAVLPDRIDALIAYRPLGATVPPSVLAVPLAFVAAWIAKRFKHPKVSRGLKVFGFGLAGGLLQRAIAKRSLASGTSGVEGTPQVD